MGEVVPIAATNNFQLLWERWHPKRRGNKILARAKYTAIIGPGLATKMLDKTNQEMVEVFLTATEDEIMAGAKEYISGFLKDFQWLDEQYMMHVAQFLNRGEWLR